MSAYPPPYYLDILLEIIFSLASRVALTFYEVITNKHVLVLTKLKKVRISTLLNQNNTVIHQGIKKMS